MPSMRALVAAAVAAALLSPAAASASTDPRVKNVVVLMLENRAFDHLVGMQKARHPEIDGCVVGDSKPTCSCPVDPRDPTAKRVPMDDEAIYVQPADPGHSVEATYLQMWGTNISDSGAPPAGKAARAMDGFINSYQMRLLSAKPPVTNVSGSFIMKAFSPAHVPVTTALIDEFAIFDRWMASVPGPTEVNRCFAQSATSYGYATNNDGIEIVGWPQKSIYAALMEANQSWSVYFEDFPAAFLLRDVRSHVGNFHSLDTFKSDAAKGSLPAFSWLEPRYYADFGKEARDMHPDHDVAEGEQLIKEVYEALRAGPAWNETVFLITFDEHGGFADSYAGETAGVPNPDGRVSTKPPYNFTTLGVRVPTIIVSPFVSKAKVQHEAANGRPFEHSSIPGTVRKWFAPEAPALTARDAWAPTFDEALDIPAGHPRTDCPMTLPDAPPHRLLSPKHLPPLDGKRPITDLQRTFLVTAAALNGEMVDDVDGLLEGQASRQVIEHVNKFLGRHVAS